MNSLLQLQKLKAKENVKPQFHSLISYKCEVHTETI